jgi:secretion/DNA translocation related CpaE-like protein
LRNAVFTRSSARFNPQIRIYPQSSLLVLAWRRWPGHREGVTSNGVLALLEDSGLRAEVDRIAAAAGLQVVHAQRPSGRRAWSGASVVLLDAAAAGACVHLGLPRRSGVFLIEHGPAGPDEFEAAIAVGAQRVLQLPAQEMQLVGMLSEVADPAAGQRGAVVAVLGGCGGAGASVFAVALAHDAPQAFLVDADPWGGGLDLVLGIERDAGLRWADLTAQGGRLNYSAMRDALPVCNGVAVLSAGRACVDVPAGPLAAVVDAGSRAGATVVCDLPRQASDATEAALDGADLVVLVVPADVRSCAAATLVGAWVSGINPNIGLVVRGPAPGGLRAKEVAAVVGHPLLASMRAEPGLAGVLERGGLRTSRRSPLAAAARQVLGVLRRQPGAAMNGPA